jgi:hypothetical protein
MELFTDASYCHKTGVGVISIDIYVNDELINKMDRIYQDIKNSDLEKLGIDICHEHAYGNYTIYTDCKSSKSNNIIWIKGHGKVSKHNSLRMKFRRVDIRSRNIMRSHRKRYYPDFNKN